VFSTVDVCQHRRNKACGPLGTHHSVKASVLLTVKNPVAVFSNANSLSCFGNGATAYPVEN
ncbi:hypothetical protein, partial [Enterobacter hormaechei]|uniref:hypothetical protein n=1 Tax=Enterobacter hormaechei TaxID=158836 RepID=UPI0034CF1758